MNLFVVIEEDLEGARVAYVSDTKEQAEDFIQKTYARELRWLMEGVWRCGASVISIQQSTLNA